MTGVAGPGSWLITGVAGPGSWLMTGVAVLFDRSCPLLSLPRLQECAKSLTRPRQRPPSRTINQEAKHSSDKAGASICKISLTKLGGLFLDQCLENCTKDWFELCLMQQTQRVQLPPHFPAGAAVPRSENLLSPCQRTLKAPQPQ
jgi:hypothetical protein